MMLNITIEITKKFIPILFTLDNILSTNSSVIPLNLSLKKIMDHVINSRPHRINMVIGWSRFSTYSNIIINTYDTATNCRASFDLILIFGVLPVLYIYNLYVINI